MPLILYKNEASPPARAVMMVADILELNMDLRDINPVMREQDTPEMTQKNPMRTVPSLEDGDFCLADSHAIILYLVEKYGNTSQNTLYPKDLKIRSTIHQMLFIDCGILFPRLRTVMAPCFGGKLRELSRAMIRNIDDAYRMLEAYLSQTEYLAGSGITIADVSTVATVSALHGLHAIDERRFPKTLQWLNKMATQSFYKRKNAHGNELLVSILKNIMVTNQNNQKSKL